jgi:hypothetical protein
VNGSPLQPLIVGGADEYIMNIERRITTLIDPVVLLLGELGHGVGKCYVS